MSRTFSSNVLALANELESTSGSYLQSTIRVSGLTCEVCCTPVLPQYPRCVQCNKHLASEHQLADRVGSLIYAVEPTSQSYLLVSNYKTNAAGPNMLLQMAALLGLGLRGHATCAMKLAGAKSTGWAVVPSTKGRSTLHEYASQLAQTESHNLGIEFLGCGRRDRNIHPEYWKVDVARGIPDHVILIDDSWVSGAHAQGVAAALKAVGVSQVSIFTVANVLDPNWEPNPSFIREHLAPPAFDKLRCPWTGADCP